MKLSEARCALGRRVTYSPEGGEPENGVIMRCNGTNVFVNYGGGNIRATSPDDLAFAE